MGETYTLIYARSWRDLNFLASKHFNVSLIVNELVGIGIEDKLHKFDQNSYVHLRVFFFFNHKIGRSFLFIDFISIIIFLYYKSSYIMFFSL